MKKGIQITQRVMFAAAGMIMLFCLTGCEKSSAAKVQEAQSIYTELVARHNEVVSTYAEVNDDSMGKQLDEMAQKINEIGNQDLKECSVEEIDAIIAGIKENIASYDEILKVMEESMDKEEEQPVRSAALAIKNNTGVNLVQIFLYPAGEEDRSKNLIEDLGELNGYDTVNITDFHLAEGAETWELLALNDKGNTIIKQELQLAGYAGASATVLMDYNFDRSEGWITVTTP